MLLWLAERKKETEEERPDVIENLRKINEKIKDDITMILVISMLRKKGGAGQEVILNLTSEDIDVMRKIAEENDMYNKEKKISFEWGEKALSKTANEIIQRKNSELKAETEVQEIKEEELEDSEEIKSLKDEIIGLKNQLEEGEIRRAMLTIAKNERILALMEAEMKLKNISMNQRLSGDALKSFQEMIELTKEKTEAEEKIKKLKKG